MDENASQYGKHRFWEMIPGILIWTTFLLAIGASFFAPAVAVIFIIIFDLYWTMRVLYFLFFVLFAHRTYRKAMLVDWYAKTQEIQDWDRLYHVVFLPTVDEGISILRDAMESIKESAYRNDRFIVVLGGEETRKREFLEKAEQIKTEYENVFAYLLITVHPKGLPGEIVG